MHGKCEKQPPTCDRGCRDWCCQGCEKCCCQCPCCKMLRLTDALVAREVDPFQAAELAFRFVTHYHEKE